jgi:hypothetical protein
MDYFVINPHSMVYRLFRSLVVLCCLASSFVYAFYAAFRNDVDNDPSQENDPILEIENLDLIQYVFEGIFLVDMLLKFILEYKDDFTSSHVHQVRDVSMISLRYLKTKFAYDLIPLIPFNMVFHFRYSRVFYLVKCMRLLDTFQVLDTGKFMA